MNRCYVSGNEAGTMKLTGDERGVRALKELFNTNKEYVRFILKEAETSTDHTSDFRTGTGEKFILVYSPKTAEFKVKLPEQ